VEKTPWSLPTQYKGEFGAMLFEGKVTTDRNFIRKWVEMRHGRPARRKADAAQRPNPELQIVFADPADSQMDSSLEAIDRDQFFEQFDHDQLAFLYQEWTTSGGLSRDFRFL
jgi:hypothetical protein